MDREVKRIKLLTAQSLTSAFVAYNYGMGAKQSFKNLLQRLELWEEGSQSTKKTAKKYDREQKADEARETANNIVSMITRK